MAGNAMGSGRACDNCKHKRARWYCAADDAFLCQVYDASVHSANQLARRHKRVRFQLQAAAAAASWHHGFTRKARSPRNLKRSPASLLLLHHPQPKHHDQDHKFPTPPPLVPEMGSDEEDENDEQFLCRVPTFHQFDAELGMEEYYETSKPQLHEDPNQTVGDLDSLTGFRPSDMDLAEFAADWESHLGDDHHDSCGIKGLIGDLDFQVEDDMIDGCCFGEEIHKMKVVKQEQVDPEMMTNEEEEEEMMTRRSKISLSLNYEDVITPWASQGSPWTIGNRPEFGPNHYIGGSTALTGLTNYHWASGGGGGGGGGGDVGASFGDGDGDVDGGREARVLRYREKRRTCLFSKKIRYEVRKLNAEKRPRMKGRFVKRASINAASAPRFSLLQSINASFLQFLIN